MFLITKFKDIMDHNYFYNSYEMKCMLDKYNFKHENLIEDNHDPTAKKIKI